MYLLLLLATEAENRQSSWVPQGTPLNVMNASRCHCLSLVRLRNERANSIPTAVPTMTSSLSPVRPRNVLRGPARFQLCHLAANNFEVYRFTHLRQLAVTFLAPQTGPRTATIISLHTSTVHVRRVLDRSR